MKTKLRLPRASSSLIALFLALCAGIAAIAIKIGDSYLALLALAGAGAVLLWRHQRAEHYKQLYRAEVERRALVGHLDCLTRFANDIVMLADEERGIVEVNDRAIAAYGYSREELLGMSPRKLRDPATLSDFDQKWGAVGTGLIFEARHRRKDGSTFPVEVSTRIVEVDGRKFRQAIVRDITERKRLEERLREAQRLESVGRLAGGVAHDFNNLLTVINGYGDLLLGRLKPGDPLRTSVAAMRKAGQRTAELTRQLLALSSKSVFVPKPLNLNRLIEETRDVLQRILGVDIEFTLELEPTLGTILADRPSLHQVLADLVSNARDAMSGRGRLTIATANAELDSSAAAAPASTKTRQPLPDGRGSVPDSEPRPSGSGGDTSTREYVMLAVTDTGAGMDEQTRQHIFEPFFAASEGGKGAGLGLSAAYGIVRQLGGWIAVDSEPGRGATFKIYLPRLEETPAAGEAEAPAPLALSGSETVLVVEDHAEVRRLAATILAGYGYRVLEAEGGPQALGLAERHPGPIDLLLTDVVMPRMNGKDLADRIGRLREHVKVLFMSGYADDVIDLREAAGAGVDFVAKPFAPEDLARKVRQVLGAERAAGAILVVDDEEGIRSLFRDVLEGAGHRVSVASNGSEALARVRERRFDLVVTDLVMPEREGIETIRDLRKEHPGIKIIAVSGAFGGAMLRAARVLGADAALSKPVKPTDLLDTVRAVLE